MEIFVPYGVWVMSWRDIWADAYTERCDICKVSTEHEAQLSALENQVQYYDDLIDRYRRYIEM